MRQVIRQVMCNSLEARCGDGRSGHLLRGFRSLLLHPLLLPGSCIPTGIATAGGDARNALRGMDAAAEKLRLQATLLQRDLAVLEIRGDPALAAHVAVFVLTDDGSSVRLTQVDLGIDGRESGTHAYTEIESEALRRGGAHRLMLGGVKPGAHELTARIRGIDAGGDPFMQEGVLRFATGATPSFVQLRVGGTGTADLRMTLME